MAQARHWSAPETFGSRAKFNTASEPATLDLEVSVTINIVYFRPVIRLKKSPIHLIVINHTLLEETKSMKQPFVTSHLRTIKCKTRNFLFTLRLDSKQTEMFFIQNFVINSVTISLINMHIMLLYTILKEYFVYRK